MILACVVRRLVPVKDFNLSDPGSENLQDLYGISIFLVHCLV